MYFLLKIKAMKWLQFLKFFLWNKNIHPFSPSSSGIRVWLEACITQSLQHQADVTNNKEPVCHKKPANTWCFFFLLNYKPNHQREETFESTKPRKSFHCLLHWFKTCGVAEGRSVLKWRVQGPTNRNSDSEGLQLGPRIYLFNQLLQWCRWSMDNILRNNAEHTSI